MKYKILLLALVISNSRVIAGGFGSARLGPATSIRFIITNNTDQELTLEGRYKIRPSQQPELLDMPNPFEYETIPPHSKDVGRMFTSVKRGGRLGALVEVRLLADKQVIQTFVGSSLSREQIVIVNPEDLKNLQEK